VLQGHGDLDQLVYREDFPDPEVGSGEVLVRIGAVSVNYHDIFTRRGMPGIKIRFPMITGSDVAGEVVRSSPDVQGWKAGDRVLINPVRYGERMSLLGETTPGGKAEFVSVAASQLIRLPDAVNFRDAACIPLAYGTAHRMIVTQGRVGPGDRVLVLGASGGVGTACVQLCKLAGAEVAACAGSAEKLTVLARQGADHLINHTQENFLDAVMRIWGKPKLADRLGTNGATVVVNFTGGDTWPPSLRCLARGGRLLTCGATAGFDAQMDLRFVWTFEYRILGSNGWELDDLQRMIDLLATRRIQPVIDRVLPLEQAAEAERLLERREVTGKVVIEP
jgi:alcohol dehydrogenase